MDADPARSTAKWVLWGSELSPFALKVEALLRFHGVPHRWMPAGASFAEAFSFERRRRALIAGRLALTWPRMSALDEFPQVPFLFGPGGETLYDSSAIAVWLAEQDPERSRDAASTLGTEEPALRFLVQLIDEALDEVGLYLVHHNRWVLSARDNDAGLRLSREMRPLLGPLARVVRVAFPARQVRRLPYLFSVAATDSDQWKDLPGRLRPPSRGGFPATHELLDQAFLELLAAVEPVLARRSYLFGQRFTLADASLYGQLCMNRSDPSAWALLSAEAPATAAWIDKMAAGDFAGHLADAPLLVDEALAPLLSWIGLTFVPLMQQNRLAWQQHREQGQTLFNEAAFDAGLSLYSGELLGHEFRSVAKTFQVRVWQDLRRTWDALNDIHCKRIRHLAPALAGLDRD